MSVCTVEIFKQQTIANGKKTIAYLYWKAHTTLGLRRPDK